MFFDDFDFDEIINYIFVKNLIYFYYISAGLISLLGFIFICIYFIQKSHRSLDLEENTQPLNDGETCLVRYDGSLVENDNEEERKRATSKIYVLLGDRKLSYFSRFKSKVQYQDAVIGFARSYEFSGGSIFNFIMNNLCLYITIALGFHWFFISIILFTNFLRLILLHLILMCKFYISHFCIYLWCVLFWSLTSLILVVHLIFTAFFHLYDKLYGGHWGILCCLYIFWFAQIYYTIKFSEIETRHDTENGKTFYIVEFKTKKIKSKYNNYTKITINYHYNEIIRYYTTYPNYLSENV
jgi:hypothetical protein